ncbi:flagellar assembly protein FliH [Desulfonatronum thiosulfatophilum]|uniref:Flagellar assembly protein FliH n=1 Tax=Desulfonatronum thiosulfatophilum TaxID=617002 RepID=A0A1G6AVB4_9BACT|nr:FliH/SctL family protein [Desulfonatronum thiosulfatophilum]SDB12294.1 flagellar assembly protein FliH [Desulfonatronum thiosulfatophilum]
MSFSSAPGADQKPEGRIIIGPRSVGLAELTLNSGRQEAWNLEAEEEYLSRVRIRAQDMAREILAQAMAEAEQVRAQAHEEGYHAGQAQADAELMVAREQAADQCAAILNAIQEQGKKVWRTHRADLISLLHIMVEKTIAVELEAHRQESLAVLLDQAVDMIDSKRKMVFSVHPRDRELIEAMLRQTRNGGDQLDNWKIKEDPRIEQGGLILECDHGMVDNTIASRRAGLEDIIAQLTLEESN